MSFKEQFINKNYNEEELFKGHVNNLSYEEYVYYLACLADHCRNKRKYQHALYFYDHLLKSVGCNTILRQYYRLGRKVPKELKIYDVDLENFTSLPEIEKLKKRIDKIGYVHVNKKFIFQMLMILAGGLLFCILHLLFKVDLNPSLIIAFSVAAITPLFYRPKPIQLDKKEKIEQHLINVTKYNQPLLDYVQKQIKKDKGAPRFESVESEKE